ncbi:MAG: 23S rRNA (pseudouridine(1915)-N(3))-methyltransferase RlmH [Oscillospiraceae bacterium]|nr:23S rRNA (pseudouridine(1915)-N(3))-methyltransferase RlmH [Oscillospiraceae bacterium]
MNFTVISVGRLKESYWVSAVDEYAKRIKAFGKLRLIDVKEDAAILDKIPKGSYVFALCIEGQALTSEEFSEALEKIYVSEKKGICFIIGGADGLPPKVKSVSDMRLSMSGMTFPHRLAKVMLLEQIYRALSIQNNKKYHKV